MSLQQAHYRLISSRRQGVLAKLLCGGLRALSWGYGAALHLRNVAYDTQLLPSHGVEVPVISIGNVVAGGTGKTPVTLFLAERLARFKKLAILSRGYRSPAEKRKELTVLSRGEGPQCSADDCGDEAFLMARHLPGALVIVGRDRVQAAREAVRMGAELILLDDGMQHRRLARDVNIVVMDARRPFGFRALLPRGFLREPLSALRRADLILLTYCEPSDRLSLLDQLAVYTKAPVIATQFVAEGLEGERSVDLVGQRVGVFCGVANPQRVLQTVQEMGATVVAQLLLSDHCAPSISGLRCLVEDAMRRGASAILCTEKDAVKLSSKMFSSSPLPICWIRRSLQMDSTDEAQLLSIVSQSPC